MQDETSGGCMKNITGKITLLMAVVSLWAAAAYAQYDPHVILKVDVPFEFSVGKKLLPAGSYEVLRTAPNTLALRDGNSRLLVSIVTSPVVARDARSTPVLRFAVEGEQHVLSQVWPGAGTSGYELSIPKRVTYLAEQKPVEVPASQAGKR
jgi:hypothetical protein